MQESADTVTIRENEVSPFPDATSYETVALEDVRTPILRRGIDYWLAKRGNRLFPSRDDIKPREISNILTNMVLARVIDGGADFELRIVGDEVARAYRAPLGNRRLSEIAADLPKTATTWDTIYRRVAVSRTPFVIRVRVGMEAPEINYVEAEVACLPLGRTDDAVDHLITFGRRTLFLK